MKVHFISGLGADERVFRLLELPGIEKVFVKWEKPAPKESLPEYASRLIEQIDLEDDVILVGVSFGGIVAQEIAQQVPCKKVIIISSIKSCNEMAWLLRLIKRTEVHKLFPLRLFARNKNFAVDYFFGTKSKGESLFLRQILADTDEEFFTWAIHKIMTWKNEHSTDGVFHIHGTFDKIFPYYSIKNCVPIDGGGHFMIVNRADEISRYILQELNKVDSNPTNDPLAHSQKSYL